LKAEYLGIEVDDALAISEQSTGNVGSTLGPLTGYVRSLCGVMPGQENTLRVSSSTDSCSVEAAGQADRSICQVFRTKQSMRHSA
jgi:hypothetical protein